MNNEGTSVCFPLKLPIAVYPGDGRALNAETVAVSATEILFHCDTPLAIGVPITFQVALPGIVFDTSTDLSVDCTGRVVSCVEENGKSAVEATIDDYSFRRMLRSSQDTVAEISLKPLGDPACRASATLGSQSDSDKRDTALVVDKTNGRQRS